MIVSSMACLAAWISDLLHPPTLRRLPFLSLSPCVSMETSNANRRLIYSHFSFVYFLPAQLDSSWFQNLSKSKMAMENQQIIELILCIFLPVSLSLLSHLSLFSSSPSSCTTTSTSTSIRWSPSSSGFLSFFKNNFPLKVVLLDTGTGICLMVLLHAVNDLSNNEENWLGLLIPYDQS